MKRLTMITAGFLLLSLSLLAFLLGSSAGFQVIISAASALSGNAVSVGTSHGRLLGSLSLKGINLVTAAAEISIAELDWRWRPAALFQGQLHVADLSVKEVLVSLQQTGQDEESAGGPFLLPELSLPLSFLLGRISLENLLIRDEQGGALVSIDRLSGSMSGTADQLKLDELTLHAKDYGLSVHGALQMSSGWPVDLNGSWWAELPECSKVQGAVAVDGRLAEPELMVSTILPQRLQVKGSFKNLFDRPSGMLEGWGKNIDPAGICSGWPEASVDLAFTSSGSIGDYRAHLETNLTLKDTSPIQAVTDFSGDERGIVVESAQIESKGNQAKLSGRLDWQEQLSWDASLSLHAFDLSVYEDLPQLLIDAEILSEGQLAQDGLHYQVSTKSMEGTMAEPQLTFSGALHLAGDLEQLHVSKSIFHVGDGLLKLNGGLDWSSGLAWEAHALLQALDPSLFPPLPAGRVNAEISTNGSLDSDKISFDAVIASLSGTLAGYDLEGGGRIGYRDGQFNARNLYIKNGGNLILVEGVVDDSFGLDFNVAASELHLLFPQFQGNVQLTGRLGGNQQHPVLTVSGEGHNMSYQDYHLDALQLKAQAGISEGGRIEADLSLADLDIEGVQVKQVTVGITGDLQSHEIVIAGKTEKETLRLTGTGSYLEPAAWQGTIAETRYEHIVYGSWQQKDRAGIVASAADAKIDNLCLSSGRTSLCVGGSWDNSGDWTFEAANLHLDLAELNRWQLFSPPVSGLLTGRLTARGNDTVIREGSGRIEIPVFSMTIDSGLPDRDFRWNDTVLAFTLADQQLQTTLVSRFVDGSTVNSELQLETSGNISEPFAPLPVRGTVQLDLKDLSPLIGLTGDYLVPSGHLTADIAVDGTLGNPAINGDVTLRDGELRFPSLGISLTEVSGNLRGEGRRAKINLQAVSGGGTATGSGDLDFSGKKWQGAFTVTGKSVELINQSELSIIADPDVTLVVGPDGGSLSGSVFVSEALISPEEMKNSDVVSDDVVFVDGTDNTAAWPFTYQIAVELGEDVRVEGYGLSSNLRGKLDVRQAPDGAIIGRGELNTYKGSFSIYNRSIDLSKGRILFDGGPIGNPGLDISARKSIQSERAGMQDIVVGIDVTGTVHDHKVELFSNPHLEDREIVAYILLDKSFASSDGDSRGVVDAALSLISSGKGSDLLGKVANILPVDTVQFAGGIGADGPSLVVGKKLTENLSVGYDYNLFKNKGFFKVRYYFGRGFSLESRNSVETNGVEFLYSFER